MRWVGPTLTTSAKDTVFLVWGSRSRRAAGRRGLVICVAAAMCIAVGNTSFELCERFTSSFGWMGFFDPILPPAISIALFAITSLAFMLVCVPLPVCQTESGK